MFILCFCVIISYLLTNYYIGQLFPFIAITESWLKSYNTDAQLDIPGYSLSRSDRSKRTGGGVMLYSLSSLPVSVSETYDDSYCQGIFNVYPSAKLCVAVVYRPPDASFSSFSKLIAKLSHAKRTLRLVTTTFS